jgi:hypothetical protein
LPGSPFPRSRRPRHARDHRKFQRPDHYRTEIDGSLKSLQYIVGGLIEPVYQGLDEPHHCYVNEEGLLEKSFEDSMRQVLALRNEALRRAGVTSLSEVGAV